MEKISKSARGTEDLAEVVPAFYSERDLIILLGISRSTINNKAKPTNRYYDPKFPERKKVLLSGVGYDKEEVDRWIKTRPLAFPPVSVPSGKTPKIG